MEGGRARRLVNIALWIAVLVFVASLALQKIRTFDYWWHLRTGQLIAETGAVPKVDVYTYTVPGNRWVDIHWLHQVGLWNLYQRSGHAGVVVAKGLCAALVAGLLGMIGYRRERAVVTAFALALMALLASDRFMPRPELVSFALLALQLVLLDRFTRRNDAWIYAIVPLQIVWVNVHGLFALGLALCAIYLAAEIVRPIVNPGESLRPAWLRRLAVVTALAAVASLANPNGLDGALYPIQQLGMIGPAEDRGVFGSLIAELIPPLSPRGGGWNAYKVLFAAAGATSFAAMVLNWRRIHAADPLLWVAFLYLALGAQRNIALFAVVATPILVRNLNEFLDARARALRVPVFATAVCAGALALLAADVASGRLLTRLGTGREPGLGVLEIFHPTAAVDWIERERPPGPIFHHMADGGYLIWRLHPDYLVMVDGRLEVFGSEKFLQLQAGLSDHLKRLDAEYGFGVVLLHYSLINSAELLRWLYFNSNWRLAFVDDVAAVFVRVPEGGLDGEDEVDIDAPDLFEPIGPETTVTAQIRLMARTNFYTIMRRFDRALETWDRALERFPDIAGGPVIRAFLLQKNGLGAAAEALLRIELEKRPDDKELHTQVGDLRMESGDLEAAKRHYDTALGIDPNFAYAMFRRGQIAEGEGDDGGAAGLYLRVFAQGARSGVLAEWARLRLEALEAGR